MLSLPKLFFHRRPSFTLIEIMVSVAIFAILTSIVFASLAQEKSRAAIKQAADQFAVDLQDMQNRAQSGIITSGVTAAGYGLLFTYPPGNSYQTFVDATGGTYTADLYDSGASPDPTLLTRTLSSNIRIIKLTDSTNIPSYNRADVVFHVPNATVSLLGNISTSLTNLTIKLKNIQLNVCYAVSIQKTGGTVTKRQLSTCS